MIIVICLGPTKTRDVSYVGQILVCAESRRMEVQTVGMTAIKPPGWDR